MHRVMQAERVKSSQYPDEVTTNDVIEQVDIQSRHHRYIQNQCMWSWLQFWAAHTDGEVTW